MVSEQLPDRTLRNDGKHTLYQFDVVGELPKRKSKTPTIFVAKNLISCHLFDYLKGFHIPTYFLSKEEENVKRVKHVTDLPFEITIRNVASGEFATQFLLEENTRLVTPVMDFHFSDKAFKHIHINESYLCAFGYIEPEEMKILVKQAGKINAVLKSFFSRRNLHLDTICLRFGRTQSGNIVLAHELSPDTLFISEQEKVKKARFDLSENYTLAFYERVIGF
mgnify:CR=1 FL=1